LNEQSLKKGTLLRILVAQILGEIEEQGVFAEAALTECFRNNVFTDERDKNLLTALVYGVLRERGTLDWFISRLYHGNFASLETPIKNILRCAFFQIRSLTRIPPFAICNEAGHSARQLAPAAGGLINALCREFLRQGDSLPLPSGEIPANAEALLSHPPWLVAKMLVSHPEALVRAMCWANNKTPPLFLRVNTLKTTQEALQKRLRSEGIDTIPCSFAPLGLCLTNTTQALQKSKAFAEGLFLVQDEASQLIPYLLEVAPGERILDMCAGRGIKTTQIAAFMENRGFLLARDVVPSKLKEMAILATRLGATNIEIALAPVNTTTAITTQHRTRRSPLHQEPSDRRQKALFDKILLDVPCSGTGVLRRHPEIKWRLRENDLQGLIATQKGLLAEAADLLKIGGRLLYATCSVLAAENEEVIADFLRHNPHFTLEKSAAPGGISTACWRKFSTAAGYFATPPIRNGFTEAGTGKGEEGLATQKECPWDMGGFFAACLRKTR